MKLLWRWVMIALLVMVVASLTLWLKNNDGGVQIIWLGYQISAPFWLLIVAVVVSLCAATLVIWAVMRLKFWRKKSVMQKATNNQQKGLSEATKIISSLVLGDANDAAKHLHLMAKSIGTENALYQLLDFHVAAKDGRILPLEKLEQYEETKLLALSAKAHAALQQNDAPAALLAAKQAYELRPNNLRIALQYFGLLLQNSEFAAAQITLKKIRKLKGLSSSTLQSIAYFVQSKQHENQEYLLQESFDVSPDFAPAYEEIIATQKHSPKDAWKKLQTAWQQNPHPELVEIMLQYFPSDELAKRTQKMADMHPNSIETQWLMANVAMAGKNYDVARNHLKAALAISPQMRIYKMLVRLEEQVQDEKAAKIWLQKTASAQPDPAWICANCGHVHAHWQLECDSCHSFTSIEFGEYKAQQKSNSLLYLN